VLNTSNGEIIKTMWFKMTKNMKIRNFPLIIIGMLMISTILYSATTVRPASAADGTPVLFVDPPETIVTDAVNGTLFNVNVTLANVTSVAGVQWDLAWNASQISCTTITENLFATVTPAAFQDNIWRVSLKKDNVGGNATYAVTFQNTEQAVTDGYAPINITTSEFPEGKIATAILTFNVTQAPPVNSYYDGNFTFLSVKVGDLLAQDLNVTGINQTAHYRIYGPPETTNTTITYQSNNYTVTTVTNASLVPGSMEFAKLNESSYKLDFNLTGTDGATAYVNVTIPKALMTINPTDTWTVNVNGTGTTPIITSDDTLNVTYFYITTTLSTNVEIWGTVPEYTMLFIPLLMAATLVAFGLRRRRKL
jgi:uncharacterized protein YcnI